MLNKIIHGLVLIAISGIANAAFIDFEDQGVAVGTQINPAPGVGIVSGGFNIDPGPINNTLNDLHIHNEDGLGNNGSTHLGTHDDVVVSLLAGVFSIHAFDFEGHIAESNIQVVGSFFGGGTISTIFNADLNPATYETFNFSNSWINLTSVAFNYLGNGANGFFIDNIEVNRQVATAAEPAIIAILGIGIAGILFTRKRHQYKTTGNLVC